MSEIKYLYETIKEKAFNLGLSRPEMPEHITSNLKYNFFEWQNDAFENFLIYGAIKEKETPNLDQPTHLMFNMATGTGKTLLMAAAILHYYERGYRHILFFVNQNNIVDKTENNFINSTHNKYLFTEKIIINDKTVHIKKVDTFSDTPQGIEIKFTSIQTLYNNIHLQEENQTTLDDLHGKNIVMLADEAHHLNAKTKKNGTFDLASVKNSTSVFNKEMTRRTSEGDKERKGWEHTVIQLILHKNGSSEQNTNVLLEFTATIPDTESVAQKYHDKIIYRFNLKNFLQKGYTKEINLISSTLSKQERVLQALLFQWYRHKIALKHGLVNFKPVILFRSKTIEESKSDFEEFLDWIDRISISDLNFLKTIADKIHETNEASLFEMGKSRTEQVLDFIRSENIHWGEITQWIKQSYQQQNVIITNSQDKKINAKKTKTEKTDEKTEKLLNSLEDKNNHIRAIFTVNRLTEGWDVLNLFDIVRLYQTQPTGGSTKKTPKTTTEEKQLIERGVRYFPFAYKDTIKNKRKFDDDLQHELRVLEELYYYTYDEESRCLSHLKEELKRDGYISDDKVAKTFSLKREFQESTFYETTKLWYNEQIDNPQRRKKDLDDIDNSFFPPYKIKGFEYTEGTVDFEHIHAPQKVHAQEQERQTINKTFGEIERHIVQKAINIRAKQENSLYQFENLQKELEIGSMEELRAQLAHFNISITVPHTMRYENIDNTKKLDIVLKFLSSISTELKNNSIPKIGSDFVSESLPKFFAEPKTKVIQEDKESESRAQDLAMETWYVLDSFYGTSEERGLIEFIKNTIGDLRKKYSNIYLLRNEEVYKIYDFERGRGFQPDFILFLKTTDKQEIPSGYKTELYYQIFIEPKGDTFLDADGTFSTGKEGWKERFLEEISERYGFENIIRSEDPHYRLIGLPFFNEKHNTGFKKAYNTLIHNE